MPATAPSGASAICACEAEQQSQAQVSVMIEQRFVSNIPIFLSSLFWSRPIKGFTHPLDDRVLRFVGEPIVVPWLVQGQAIGTAIKRIHFSRLLDGAVNVGDVGVAVELRL